MECGCMSMLNQLLCVECTIRRQTGQRPWFFPRHSRIPSRFGLPETGVILLPASLLSSHRITVAAVFPQWLLGHELFAYLVTCCCVINHEIHAPTLKVCDSVYRNSGSSKISLTSSTTRKYSLWPSLLHGILDLQQSWPLVASGCVFQPCFSISPPQLVLLVHKSASTSQIYRIFMNW